MPKYQATLDYLKDHKKKWLITGVGGFIGSNLLEKLLQLDQSVIGIDKTSRQFGNFCELRKKVESRIISTFF